MNDNSFIFSFYEKDQKQYKVIKFDKKVQEYHELFHLKNEYYDDNVPKVSPNGKYLAMYDSEHSLIKIFKILPTSVSFIRDIDISDWQSDEGSFSADYGLTFSPDGGYVAIRRMYGSSVGGFTTKTNVNVWEIETGDQVGKTIDESYGRVGHSALGVDGQYLANVALGSSAPDLLDISYIRIKDTTTGKSVESPTEISQQNLNVKIKFSPDRNYFMTFSNKTLWIWELRTGKIVTRLVQKSPIKDAIFNQENNQLILLTADGILHKRPWKTSDLVQQSCELLNRNMSWREWTDYMGSKPYQKTCQELPVHPSVIDEAYLKARWNEDFEGAREIFKNVLEIENNKNLIDIVKELKDISNSRLAQPDLEGTGEADTQKLEDWLIKHSCDRIRNYLKNNPNVAESDRSLCDDIP